MATASLDIAASLIEFDRSTGKLSILGDTGNNTVQEWISDDGYLQLILDGQAKSSDPLSAFFDSRLQGVTRDTLTRINFDGGEGRDTLLVGNQSLDRLEIAADDDILINGNAIIATDSLDVSADTITATGSLTGSKINLNSRDALKLESGTKITSQDGDKGGTVHLLGKEVSLTGVAIDASGVNGGGTVLIGGDYQGKGSVPNARTTFIDASTVINVDALQKGDGGRAIVWADDTTRFLGKINARGGSVSGDGGFAEVSGKQNLSFNGTANLDAINGNLGTLLLDPANIRIADMAEVTDADPNIYNYRSLESISGNILLEATQNITIDPNISLILRNPLSSVTFIAGEQFSMDPNMEINVYGKTDIAVSAKGIRAGSISTRGGDINLTANNNISVSSLGSFPGIDAIGGDIEVISTDGSIKFEDRKVIAYDQEYTLSAGIYSRGEVISGNINIKAGKSIDLAQDISTLSSGNVGNINITSMTGDILNVGNLYAQGTGTGNGGTIKLKSEQGGISTNDLGSYISTWSLNENSNANGGNIEVNAAKDIDLGLFKNLSSYGDGNGGTINLTSSTGKITASLLDSSGNQGTGGNIKVNAAKDIHVGYGIASSSGGSGNGGIVKLKSEQGKVTIGGVFGDSYGFLYSNSSSGIGGDIEVVAANDIGIASEVKSNSGGSGDGGAIALTSTDGNITTGSLRSDSTQGTGGNITINQTPSGTVRITGTEKIDDVDFSIFAGTRGNPTINIFHSGSLNPGAEDFTVGDATVNGTAGAIMAGADLIADALPFDAPYTLGNISINTVTPVSSNNSAQIKQLIENDFQTALAPSKAAFIGLAGYTLKRYEEVVKKLQAFKELSLTTTFDVLKASNIQVIVADSIFNNIQILLDASRAYSVIDRAQIAYILATVSHESQFGIIGAYPGPATHNPMYEYSGGEIGDTQDINYFSNNYDNRSDFRHRGRGSGDGFRYRGRGFVQLTGRDNYERLQQLLGVDITATNGEQIVNRVTTYKDGTVLNQVTQYTDEADPDKVANDKNLAAKITVLGMRDSLFTQDGRGLSYYVLDSDSNPDFYNARRIVNALDEATSISRVANIYWQTLRKIQYK